MVYLFSPTTFPTIRSDSTWSSSHMQHLDIHLLYTTTTGHPAICNTWTSIYCILQPQVIQPYATPGQSIYCILQPQVIQPYATPEHPSIVYYNHRLSSHIQHLNIHLLYTTTTSHPAICNTWTVHLLYATTTGHPAICNTWTFIYCILQPQVIQPHTTPEHPSIVYYNHRSSSHMQHLDIHLLYTTTTGHPAICNTWIFIYRMLQPQVIQPYATPEHPSIVYYNHRSSSHIQHLDIHLLYATTPGHPAICNTDIYLLYTTTIGHPAICNTWTVHLL